MTRVAMRGEGRRVDLSWGWALAFALGCTILTGDVSPRKVASPSVASMAATWSLAELAWAEALRKEGKLDDAELVAGPLVAHADTRVRATALGIVARIRRVQGKPDEAMTGLKAAAEA